ncbi:hypothetical protein BX611_2800 [Lutibacter oceani]|uniref:Uncharacterized protein n=1 Tax=Lutibacter oceani TaxID=1853311 RepID=A0A3D9RJ56_9FLAO|nr:hypothetical protein BX611_2800 [Lutibacter oceani]
MKLHHPQALNFFNVLIVITTIKRACKVFYNMHANKTGFFAGFLFYTQSLKYIQVNNLNTLNIFNHLLKNINK